jgi:hypothetical protein
MLISVLELWRQLWDFQPRGLLETWMQQQFYNKSHIANIYTGIAELK